MTEKTKKALDVFVDELFVNGFGNKAERLVLQSKAGLNLGGWGKKPIKDRLMKFLKAVEADHESGA